MERNEIIPKLSKLVFNIEKPMTDSLAVAWNNLTYYGKSFWRNKSTPILCQLKGRIDFGSLTALMGPSGAGKSTLLKCIFGIDRTGLSRHSEIYVNKYEDIKACFIVQDQKEHLLLKLTVRESLMFASKLKNKKIVQSGVSSDKSYHKTKVNKMLQEFTLTDCVDNIVMDCSGGEQKRLVLAMELISEALPNLICIDEPTSGLDSNAAEQVVECLQDIAFKNSIAIVASIHQPNTDILMMFDHLYVLAKAGRCVYSGSPENLREHLNKCEISCAEWQVPIEVLLKVSSKKNREILPSVNIECIDLGPPEAVIRLMTAAYQSLDSLKFECKQFGALSLFGLFANNRYFSLIDIWLLFCRSATYSWLRQWKIIVIQFFSLLFMIIILSKLYVKNVGSDGGCVAIRSGAAIDSNATEMSGEPEIGESLTEQNLKFLFFSIMCVIFVQFNAVIFTFPLEVKTFLNEHRNSWYSSGSYYWSKTIIEIPFMLFNTFVFVSIGYYNTSQPDLNDWSDILLDTPQRFALFLIYTELTLVAAQGMYMLVGVLFVNHIRMAPVFGISILIAMILFSGFYISLVDKQFLQQLANLSFIKLLFYSILIIIYGKNRCPNSVSSVLLKFNIQERNTLWINFWLILAHILLWRLLALVILMIEANPEWLFKMKNAKKVYEYYILKNRIKTDSQIDSKFLKSRKSIAIDCLEDCDHFEISRRTSEYSAHTFNSNKLNARKNSEVIIKL